VAIVGSVPAPWCLHRHGSSAAQLWRAAIAHSGLMTRSLDSHVPCYTCRCMEIAETMKPIGCFRIKASRPEECFHLAA